MARSRKKPSARTTSNAKATPKATDEPVDADALGSDADAGSADATTDSAPSTKRSRTGSAKDPVAKRAEPTGTDSGTTTSGAAKASAKGAKGAAKTPGGDVTEKAKDSTRSTSVKKAAAAESARTPGRRVAAAGQNPAWLAPTAVTLLILGLLYLVAYYLSSGMLPLPIGDWNLAVGFGVLMVGGGMLMFWK